MTLFELGKLLDIEIDGDDFEVVGINTLKDAQTGELSFLDNPKYIGDLSETKASAVFVSEKFKGQLPTGVQALVSENPYLSMAYATSYFAKELVRRTTSANISQDAYVYPNVNIGDGSTIEEGVQILSGAYIGCDVKIGKNTIIHPNVTIYNDTIIGDNCIIHAGAVMGCDGFGYAHTKDGEHIKIHHNGKVVVQDCVEIGANTTIDRAVFGETLIENGSKIDNLVHIGHNCTIGAHSIIVGQVAISGSSKLGRNVVMGGQSATSGHLEIGDFATIAARGGVTKSIKGGETYGGFPIMKHRDWLKLQAKIARFLKK